VVSHLLSPWWWTPLASNWGYIDHTINITFWITGFAFTAAIAFMAYCVFRFHHKEGRQALTYREPSMWEADIWTTGRKRRS
jgi:cytochrome c oxidase subunit 2